MCNKMLSKITLALIFFSAIPSVFASWQCLTLRGTVTCGQNATVGDKQVFIQLVDKDSSSYNDLMDEGYVAKSGSFHLSGCASDPLGNIDPLFIIHHKCKGSPKKVTIVVPDAAIDREFKYTEVINLERQFRDESNDRSPVPVCTHAPPGEGGQISRRFYYF